MKNKLLLLLIGVLIFIFSISGCKVLEFLFLPQDLSSEITGAYYIDNSSFKLIGKGAEWNAQSDDIPKYVDVMIPNRDKNQVFRIYRASNYGCKINEYVIYMWDKNLFQPGDIVKIYGTKADKIWGEANFTVPSTNEE